MTYTYAIAEVSQSTYDEIRVLLNAGYKQAIHANDDGEVLDMHGIALRAKRVAERKREVLMIVATVRGGLFNCRTCNAELSNDHRGRCPFCGERP